MDYKIQLDEEERGIIKCIEEAQIDRGFHIRDIIKKAKEHYGMSRSKVYEIVGYLEFHDIIISNKSGNRELNKDKTYYIKCQNCGCELSKGEIYGDGEDLCEECYMENHQKIRLADPWAVRSKKMFRENAGFEGTEGLSDLQKSIYEFICSKGRAKPEDISKTFELSKREAENQLAILRHCELIGGQKQDGNFYMVPFKS